MRALKLIAGVAGLLVAYLLFWPVPIDPVAWTPPDASEAAVLPAAEALPELRTVALDACIGPEDVALDAAGLIYTGCHDGRILRIGADGNAEAWADTGGRPLGMEFDDQGRLWVADGFQGLVVVEPDGRSRVVADAADGAPLLYADDLDVASDGRVFLSDASAHFRPQDSDIVEASVLEIFEHRATGRLVMIDPNTETTRTLVTGLAFANGVALAADESFVLVTDTGGYRVVRYWLEGSRAGEQEDFVRGLPSFPDNVTRGPEGSFWLTLNSPRSPDLDEMAGSPFLRKVARRLPEWMLPRPKHEARILGLDGSGAVIRHLHRADIAFALTSTEQVGDDLLIGSAAAPHLTRVALPQ